MICSFPPLVDAHTETLILGTMPGATSLVKQEYYAHKQNHFWKIMSALLTDLPVPVAFEDKKRILRQNRIGLWDVLQNCEREGSLDTNIKKPQENDFILLFTRFPSIRKIVFNGQQSHKYFIKKFGQIEGIAYYVMPSTSPANTMSFENKLENWKQFLG